MATKTAEEVAEYTAQLVRDNNYETRFILSSEQQEFDDLWRSGLGARITTEADKWAMRENCLRVACSMAFLEAKRMYSTPAISAVDIQAPKE